MKIILPNSYDYFVLDREGIDRLREYSAKFGGQDHKANDLYGGSYVGNDGRTYFKDIDTGFLISKTCKHAFKTYPKLPVGLGGMLQADVDSQPQPQQQQVVFGASQAETQNNGVKAKVDDDSPF